MFIGLDRMWGPPLREGDGLPLQKKPTASGQGAFCLIQLGTRDAEGLWGRRMTLTCVNSRPGMASVGVGQRAPGVKFILRE